MRFSTIVTRRSVLATAAGMAALLGAFAYGLAVARLHVFPYGPVTSAYRALFSTLSRSAVGLGNDLIRTNLVTLRTTSVNYWNSFDLAGNGGGITSLGNSILGVDSDGRFFLYAKSGAFQLGSWVEWRNAAVRRGRQDAGVAAGWRAFLLCSRR